MTDTDTDLIVIGSGPGGYVAAIRAAQLGLSTLLVEKDAQFGGTCLHRGCIPTKALLHSAEVLDSIRTAEDVGVMVSAPQFDPLRAKTYRRAVVEKNAKGIEFLFRKNKVDAIAGFGRLAGPNEVVIETAEGPVTRTARHILLATGSVPKDLPGLRPDGLRILNSDQILELDRVPGSLVVLGGGAVGVEFASIFASLGSKVTLVEVLPRLLPVEDEEISKELRRVFRKRGIDVLLECRLERAEPTDQGLSLELAGAGVKSLETEMLLVAVGRQPLIERLGLGEVGVATENGCVVVNGSMQTSVASIYAIGDIVQTPWLAHCASAEGILAVEHMAGQPVTPIDYDRVPSCTYCSPEVASVGLTEQQARARGHDVATGRFPFSALGKAAILGKTDGFVKVVRDRQYDELLGVHIIGAHATDLIAEACVALQIESTTEELFRTMHAHPTLSEAMAEAALAALGRAVHS